MENFIEEMEKKIKRCKFCFHKDNCEVNVKFIKQEISALRKELKKREFCCVCSKRSGVEKVVFVDDINKLLGDK